jgi:hypothetical protein
MKRAEIIVALREHGFHDGRCIALSKTGYCMRNRNHFVVFNAQVFTRKQRILKQVDLDVTADSDQLNAAARAIGQNLYVLHENAPHPSWQPGSSSIRQMLWDAVWWTRIHPEDKDIFLPVEHSLRRTRYVSLICSLGRWHDQPAYRLDARKNNNLGGMNMFGAAIELIGYPPPNVHIVRETPCANLTPFMKEPSSTKGRPVRPAFFQRSGRFEFIWFGHGQAIPAVLWDNSVRLLEGLHFTCHKGHGGIHVRRGREVVGFLWPCSIFAPEVVSNAKAQLKRVTKSKAPEGRD